MTYTHQALNAYKANQTDNRASMASPYRLVKMLFESLQDNLARARGAMEREQAAERGMAISRSIEILGCLRSSLDREIGGAMVDNLSELYLFCSRSLMTANRTNDIDKLNEAAWVIGEIQQAWEQLGEQLNV